MSVNTQKIASGKECEKICQLLNALSGNAHKREYFDEVWKEYSKLPYGSFTKDKVWKYIQEGRKYNKNTKRFSRDPHETPEPKIKVRANKREKITIDESSLYEHESLKIRDKHSGKYKTIGYLKRIYQKLKRKRQKTKYLYDSSKTIDESESYKDKMKKISKKIAEQNMEVYIQNEIEKEAYKSNSNQAEPKQLPNLFPGHKDGRDSFDGIYSKADGTIVILEAKGGDSDLGKRKITVGPYKGQYAKQGTILYIEEILLAMKKKIDGAFKDIHSKEIKNKADKELKDHKQKIYDYMKTWLKIKTALRKNTLEYLEIRTPIDMKTGTVSDQVEISEFIL